MTPKILGINDEVTVCEHCGRSDLKRTVVLDFADGDIRRYGTTCAHRACFPHLSNGQIERIAKERAAGQQQITIRTIFHDGHMVTIRDKRAI